MPWGGPGVGDGYKWPTLGLQVADWIEEWLVVPDRDDLGKPYRLTEEQFVFLLRFYRLNPDTERFHYSRGAQLMRPQKWGKDPFMAAMVWVEALGPARFGGWDATGRPVGVPVATPWIQCAATSEEQTANTFRPIVSMAREGKLADWPGLDVGETRINLPGKGSTGGRIEPVTAAARSRLGQRLSFASLTESHLMTPSSGGVTMAAAMKRNLAGMGGRWIEGTNAYDPAEQSVAQLTAEAKGPGVLIDYRPARRRVELDNEEAVIAELEHVYGDSSVVKGGWVDTARILDEIRDPSTFEADARRFFLNEIVAGVSDFVDPVVWDALADDTLSLRPKDRVCLGFDGSRNDDHTVIWVARLDGALFRGGWWEPQDTGQGYRVPSTEVDATMRRLFKTYRVEFLFADPFRWQDYLDRWAAEWPGKVVEFPTNVETRFDAAIERFLQAVKGGELTHDGDGILTSHIRHAVVVNASRKKDREPGRPEFHRKLAKKKHTLKIDAAVAAVLAWEARGHALEHGAGRSGRPRAINLAAALADADAY